MMVPSASNEQHAKQEPNARSDQHGLHWLTTNLTFDGALHFHRPIPAFLKVFPGAIANLVQPFLGGALDLFGRTLHPLHGSTDLILHILRSRCCMPLIAG